MKNVRVSNKRWDRKRLASSTAACVAASVVSSAAVASSHLHQSSFESPLGFERNDGQTDSRVDFVTRGQGYALFLTATEMVISLQAEQRTQGPHAKSVDTKPSVADVVRMQLSGGAAKAKAEGVDLLPGKVNYMTGADKEKWQTNVPVYKAVKYSGVYPGVDVVYYGKGRELEYDFVVAPGADPKAIELSFSGANVDVDAKGDLVLAANGGEVRLHKPVLYQLDGDRRVEVAGHYVREGSHGVKFQVGAYDRSQPLVIDPILSYSTYLGGDAEEVARWIAVDSKGAAYVVGKTSSLNFPTANPAIPTNQGKDDAFIAKFSPDGRKLEYATYLGGSENDEAWGVAVDGAGAAYLVGVTDSPNFPLLSPLDSKQELEEAFVAKLSADGSALVYSTFIGGGEDDQGFSIAVDEAGAAYVTGDTQSVDFPLEHPFQAHPGRSDGETKDAFVAKISPSGSSFAYSTYLGGGDTDETHDIAVDQEGSAYVVGNTYSTNFPTAAPLQASLKGGADGFVTKFAPGGDSLAYSTYLGGNTSDHASVVEIDSEGVAYVAGTTDSHNFPTVRGFQPTYAGGGDAFLVKFAASGSELEYGSYLGGESGEQPHGLAVDPAGAATVVGETNSPNFPQLHPVQLPGEGVDGFVTTFAPSGATLEYSTYLGGSGDDVATAVAVDDAGSAYVAGETRSDDFLTVRALQPNRRGGDAFVTKLYNISFAGTPALASCSAQSEAALVRKHGSLTGAFAALKLESVQELQDAIQKFCSK